MKTMVFVWTLKSVVAAVLFGGLMLFALFIYIKEFMAAYSIIDIKMRMLKVSELLAIMGFPKGFKLVGTQSEQKKFIGNAVEVTTSRRLCEALAERIAI